MPEEDEFEQRLRDLEEKAKAIRAGRPAPKPPEVKVERPAVLHERKADPAARGMGLAFAIGYSFVGPLLAGIIVGRLLDGNHGSTWTMAGIFVGAAVALFLLIRLVNRLNQ